MNCFSESALLWWKCRGGAARLCKVFMISFPPRQLFSSPFKIGGFRPPVMQMAGGRFFCVTLDRRRFTACVRKRRVQPVSSHLSAPTLPSTPAFAAPFICVKDAAPEQLLS